MKHILFVIILMVWVLSGCNSSQKRTEKTVIDRDTLEAETEYEIEKTIQKKTVEIDTITEKETVTTEEEYDEDDN